MQQFRNEETEEDGANEDRLIRLFRDFKHHFLFKPYVERTDQ